MSVYTEDVFASPLIPARPHPRPLSHWENMPCRESSCSKCGWLGYKSAQMLTDWPCDGPLFVANKARVLS